MGVDVAGELGSRAVPLAGRAPEILIFDSGLGALSVADAVRAQTPGAAILLAADDAAFPYGALDDGTLVRRVTGVVTALVERHRPDIVVVACNTASTLALPALRSRLAIPVVGTVPAIKPAAASSISRRIAVLATPGTIRRAYTAELVESFARDCDVALVGAPLLAGMAERILRGERVGDRDIGEQIAPCFVERDGRRTDTVVLACTHFPLIAQRLGAVSPWPVTFIDPSPAIARRAASLLVVPPELNGAGAVPRTGHRAVFTAGRSLPPALLAALAARGFADVAVELVD